MRHYTRLTVGFLLLTLYCVIGGLAEAGHRCIFDKTLRRAGPRPISLVHELPAGRGERAYTAASPEWAPIRIRIFTEDLELPGQHCTAAGQMRPDFSGGTVKCGEEDILTAEKKRALVEEMIPAATRLHAERLLVKPVTSALVVPELEKDGVCGYFTVPASHHTKGVSKADMLLYIAAGPTEEGVLAWATSCAMVQSGRPSVGVSNFGAAKLVASRYSIRVLAHEIAHALGFSIEEMRHAKIVTTQPQVRGKKNVLTVSSKKTKEKTRRHFGCPTAVGMELEDEGGEGTAHSHWERRNAKDELMAGIAGVGYYTALTMAAFEDLKFYRANWGKEEAMNWGRGAGCSLLTHSCVTRGASNHPDMFCTDVTDDQMQCTSDHMELGQCALFRYSRDLPNQFAYFDEKNMGGPHNHLMDFCPFVQSYSNTGCTSGAPSAMPGSRVGASSRCVKGDGLSVGGKVVGDVCVEVRCARGDLHVRYLDDDTWHACPAGGSITPTGAFSGGTIQCPRYSDVCTSL